MIRCTCFFLHYSNVPSSDLQNGCIIPMVAFVYQIIKRINIKLCQSPPHRRLDQICLSSLQQQCGFSNVPSRHLYGRKHNHIGCIYLSFLHCVFSNVSSNRLPERMRSHTGCICLAFLHCVLSHAFSNDLGQKICTHIGCIYWTSYFGQIVSLKEYKQMG